MERRKQTFSQKQAPANPPVESFRELKPTEVLQELRSQLDDVKIGFRDPAYRHFAWERFQQYAVKYLWETHETHIEDTDEYRLQLADQLDTAIRHCDAFHLTAHHLEALDLSLGRLQSPQVGYGDVRDCESAWRKAPVDTLPSLKEVLDNWQELYQVEDANDV